MKPLRRICLLVIVCLLVSFYAPAAHAQAMSSLRGIVSDMTGAVVPKAEVTLMNKETGLKRTVQTGSDGSYAFFDVPPGDYVIRSSASGFKTVNIEDVRLRVNLPATMNITFEQLGAVSQSVSVQAQAAPMNTTDSSLGNTLGTVPIIQLPIDSRNVVDLLELQPGVSTEGDVNGGKPDQGNITLDGVDVNEQQNRTAFTSVIRTPLDSVQEFRVTTLNAPADQGRTSGAQVTLVTKGGTNTLHGSAYEYNRNTEFAANNFFNNLAGIPIAALNRNVFGGSVGGPVKKNKLFYFLNFDTTVDASAATTSNTVPMANLRQGSLSYRQIDGTIATLSPAQVTSLVDPAHIGPDPVVLQRYNQFPEPNTSFLGDGVNTSGYTFNSPIHSHLRTYLARFDYLPGSGKHDLFFRGTLDNDKTPSPPQFPGQIDSSDDLNNSKGMAAGDTMILRPNMTNIVRYGLTREGVDTTGVIPPGTAGYIGVNPVVTSNANPASLYADTTNFTRIIPTHTVADDLTWVRGRHTTQFGGVFRAIRDRSIDGSWISYAYMDVTQLLTDITGSEYYQNLPTIDPAFATAWEFPNTAFQMLGSVPYAQSQYLYDKNGNVLPLGTVKDRDFASNEYEFYGLDTWRATRALTLSGGLRWSVFPPIHEANGYQSNLDPSASQWLNLREAAAAAGQSQGQAGLLQYVKGGALYDSHYRNFGPRLSVAYSPQSASGWLGKLVGGPGKTVIRAGGGVFYDLYGENLAAAADGQNLGYSASLGATAAFTGANVPRVQSWNQIPAALLTPAPPGGFPQTPPLIPQNGWANNSAIDKDIKPPYDLALNFSAGRQLPGGFFVEASYVGHFSHRTLVWADVNEPLNLIDKASGQSFFQAAQQIEKQVLSNTPVSQVQQIPFWEDLWPGAAGGGLTATQGIYQAFQANAPDWGDGALWSVDDSCVPSCSRLGPFALINDQYVELATFQSKGFGNYNALQVTARKQFQHGLLVDFNYTYSKCLDVSSGGELFNGGHYVSTFVIDTSDYHAQYARCDYDYPNLVNANWVWQIPVGRGQKFLGTTNKIVDAVIGGWQVSGIFQYRRGWESGTDNSNWDTNLNWSNFAELSAVPKTKVGRNITALDGRTGPGMFANPTAAFALFGYSYTGTAGNGRNVIAAPPFTNVDMGLGKRFKMPYKESHTIQFRLEAFNATNTTHFGPASADPGDPTDFGKILTAVNPRVVQFALRYEF